MSHKFAFKKQQTHITFHYFSMSITSNKRKTYVRLHIFNRPIIIATQLHAKVHPGTGKNSVILHIPSVRSIRQLRQSHANVYAGNRKSTLFYILSVCRPTPQENYTEMCIQELEKLRYFA